MPAAGKVGGKATIAKLAADHGLRPALPAAGITVPSHLFASSVKHTGAKVCIAVMMVVPDQCELLWHLSA